MPITKEVELMPFRVPNYVLAKMPAGLKQDGLKYAPQYALHELDDKTLNMLCDEFRAAVFKKVKAARNGTRED